MGEGECNPLSPSPKHDSLVSPELAALIQPERLPCALVSEAYGADANDLLSRQEGLDSLPQTLDQRLANRQHAIVRAIGSREKIG